MNGRTMSLSPERAVIAHPEGDAAMLKPNQEMLDLYNAYAHDVIDRRGFMDGLAKHAVGGVTVMMLAEIADAEVCQRASAGRGRSAHPG